MARAWQRARQGLLFAAVVLIAGLVALETQLRILRVPASVIAVLKDFHRADARLGWRGRPNVRLRLRGASFDVVIEHGADGYRLPEPGPPPGARRHILFLGDSLLWGWGVAQGQVLTDVLQRKLGPEVAIDNRAVSSYGTAQELLLLEELPDEPRYQAVVLLFSKTDPGDNVDGIRRRPAFALVDGALTRVSQPFSEELEDPVIRFLGDHSRAFRFLDYEVQRLADWLRAKSGAEGPDGSAAAIGEGTAPGATAIDPRSLPGYDVTRELLRTMSELARARGTRLLVAYEPNLAFPSSVGAATTIAAREMIERICAAAGIPYIDLGENFAGRRDELLLPGDGHWNAEGHRVIAETLLRSPIFQAAPRGDPAPLSPRASRPGVEGAGGEE